MATLDGDAVRRALRGKTGRDYWRSLEELAEAPGFHEWLHREWPRQAALWDRSVDRRTILRLMGASLALAGLAGCGKEPEREIVPYVEQPEAIVPGVPRYYATTLTLDGYAHGVIGETFTGRPTRVQGNADHPLNRGAASPFDTAAVLGLYDPGRSQAVLQDGQVARYEDFLAVLVERRAQWRRDGGRGVRLLTGRITSPSLIDRLNALRRDLPEARWHHFDAVDHSAALDGAKLAFGTIVQPYYSLADARTVLSLDADFLGAIDPAQLRHARDFTAGRRFEKTGRPPTRLYVIESTPSATGALADHVLTVPPSRVEALARALAQRIGVPEVAAGDVSAAEARWLDAAARDLTLQRALAPVLAGIVQPAAVHALAHAINDRLDNRGWSVAYTEPIAPAADAGIAELAADLAAGRVDTLVVLDGNPAFTAPADLDLPAKLKRARILVHWGLYADETAQLAHWHVPAAHQLESWGDARAVDGTVSLQQPLIAPLYDGRTAQELLAALGGDYGSSAQDLVRRYWQTRLPGDFERAWRAALKKGVIDGTKAPDVSPSLRQDLGRVLGPPKPTPAGSGRMELVFRPDESTWDGRFADNGWLQELPRPLTKLVWGNAAMIAPALAARLGVENGQVLRVSRGGRDVEIPAWILPGQPDGCVSLTLGYGRRAAGEIGSGVGVDVYPLRGRDAVWFATDATVAALDKRAELVTTQHHHALEGRGLVRRVDWQTYAADAGFAHARPFPPAAEHSLYPEPSPLERVAGADGWTPYDWGMSIDFDACIGCNACVVACQAENNSPIVGPEEVRRGREMHWLRIDRYYAGDPGAPATVFQPVPCMHCENAPCEYVCPVEATQHSSEGLNEMVYNRCIGTRYCSQNCPYKVRRFNWFDFTGPGADYPAIPALQNPDVTVRSRGVMEKCTYCVQRIDRARIRADREGRALRAGEVTTACQDACPTQAIVFGNINDRHSDVARRKASPRDYGLLAELNTRPRTTYLAAVRNPNPRLGGGDHVADG